MMNTVSERTLRQAQTVVEDRAERAARELMQHDVAMQAMQAGPTSLERSLELMQRERHVRAEVTAQLSRGLNRRLNSEREQQRASRTASWTAPDSAGHLRGHRSCGTLLPMCSTSRGPHFGHSPRPR